MLNEKKIYDQVRERMIRYAKINTQSARFAGTWPTTDVQINLARELEAELRKIGAADVYLDEKAAVVYAKIPAAGKGVNADPIGFVAHMDTAPDASGKDVKPWVLENYDGGDIVLNKEKNIVMKAEDYANLAMYVGQDLILTDGTTLLGGDDKASIAAIMSMAEYFLSEEGKDSGRPMIALAFTPDEEVGGLAQDLDLERFGAKKAYTLDGDHCGWYQDETFNASEAVFEVFGRSVHTGTAKGIMKNATDAAAQFMNLLPAMEKPQYTEGVEGFYHVLSCNSSCEYAKVTLIVRDFDAQAFAAREAFLRSAAAKVAEEFGEENVKLTINEQYRNMGEVIATVPELVANLRQAITDTGLTPVCEPFRGGTDGSALSFRGLPCPNLSAGYENAHGRFEYVPVQSMVKNTQILVRLCEIASENGGRE